MFCRKYGRLFQVLSWSKKPKKTVTMFGTKKNRATSSRPTIRTIIPIGNALITAPLFGQTIFGLGHLKSLEHAILETFYCKEAG
jgi:hypothetical protein